MGKGVGIRWKKREKGEGNAPYPDKEARFQRAGQFNFLDL